MRRGHLRDLEAGPGVADRVRRRATIEDPAAPVIAPIAASTWQRTPAVTVSATDASGVASLDVEERATRRSGPTTLTCDYRHLQPCPGTGSATITADLPDGTYPLTAQATDAAAQSSTATVRDADAGPDRAGVARPG